MSNGEEGRMTTPRTRRTPLKQAADILQALLRSQEAKAQRLYDAYDVAEAEAVKTRRAIELLVDKESPVGVGPIGAGTERITPASEPVLSPYTTAEVVDARLHRQKIGEKNQGISDVWNGRSNATVHTALMYGRQDKCEWCKQGLAFATEERIDHCVLTGTGEDIARIELCKGAR